MGTRPEKFRKVRITNPTGDPVLTRVLDAETGEPLYGVMRFRIEQRREGGKPYYYAEIHMEVEVDMVVDANVIRYRVDEKTGNRYEFGTSLDDHYEWEGDDEDDGDEGEE